MAFEEEDNESILVDKGFFPAPDSVLKNYEFLTVKLDQKSLERAIKRANYKLNKADITPLAESILRVSSCLAIDPWLFTGLIQKESSFEKDAVSPTFAAGLTQFTSSGLREVHDQLGINGSVGAHRKNIEYFQTKIKSCIDPNWQDVWLKFGKPEEDENFSSEVKNLLKEDVLLAVTYGGILLKTYLSHIDTKDTQEQTNYTLPEKYFLSFVKYNGEPGENKILYAQEIFRLTQLMYPKNLDTTFIEKLLPDMAPE